MKHKTDYLIFDTKKKIEFIRITERIQNIIDSSGVKEGLVLVNPMHITAAVIVNDLHEEFVQIFEKYYFSNDDEEGLKRDYVRVLQRLVPYSDNYEHNVGEDNAAAHIWRQFMAHQVVMPVTNGKLDLGPWEQIFYCEFDGLRQKRVLVKVIGE